MHLSLLCLISLCGFAPLREAIPLLTQSPQLIFANSSVTIRSLMQMALTNIQHILVRGTNWLGDAVMTTPALRRLRASFPTAHITLLATPRTTELFTAAPFINEALPYQRREKGVKALLATARTLRERRIDLALLFQNAFEAALLAWLSEANLRIGYATQGRSVLLTHALPHTTAHRHQTHDYLDLVIEAERLCGLTNEAQRHHDTTPSLTATELHHRAATSVLQKFGVTNSAPLIALNTAATNSRAKCWPQDRFAALADELMAKYHATILLIGAPSERDNAAQVIAQMKRSGAINLAGETTMIELIGVLDRCNLLVTNDTGPAHVAAALGRPTLTIFGPTNEFETAPLGANAEIIRAEGIECARCMHRDCPIDHRCMTRIEVREMMGRVSRLLNQKLSVNTQ